MTALPGRRRRSTLLAAGAAVAVAIAALGLGLLGAVTLYNSTEGADAASGLPELVFPATPTGLLAAVDESGQLASMAVLVVQPSGAGGSVIPVPVDADTSRGKGDERVPIAETVTGVDVASVRAGAEALLGLTLDDAELVGAERLREILEPFGALEVELPADVTDADGNVVADAGVQSLDAAEAAAVLTARDPGRRAIDQYPAAEAVWTAAAAAMGEGVSGDGTTTTEGPTGGGGSLDGILEALAAGSVGERGLRAVAVDDALNPGGVDVVLLDPSELALLFGQIAPGKMAAPNPALSVRIEAAFSDDQLAASGMTNADVAYAAVSQVLFVGGNVLSVDTSPAAEPVSDVTVIEVADETLIAGTDGADALFGPIDVGVGDSRIVGVDATIRLGTDYLELIAEDGPPMPSVPTTGELSGGAATTEPEDVDD